MEAGVRLMSLKLFRVADGAVLAFVNPLVNECITFEEFSSCYTNLGDSRKTFLRVLVSDLAEGETRMYGCVATTVRSFDTTQQHTWNISIYLESEFYPLLFCFGRGGDLVSAC